MARTALLAIVLVALGTLSAAAQSFSIGVGIGHGSPGFHGPYYDHYYEPPVIISPARPLRVYRPINPDSVFDMLETEGYREFSPMAERGGTFRLNAVNPEGDLVALAVSRFTGEIEREVILQPARPMPRLASPQMAVPPPAVSQPPVRQQRSATPPAEGESGADPLVVY